MNRFQAVKMNIIYWIMKKKFQKFNLKTRDKLGQKNNSRWETGNFLNVISIFSDFTCLRIRFHICNILATSQSHAVKSGFLKIEWLTWISHTLFPNGIWSFRETFYVKFRVKNQWPANKTLANLQKKFLIWC